MTTTSILTSAVWTIVAARLAVLGVRGLRRRQAEQGWRPRVTSGCGR